MKTNIKFLEEYINEAIWAIISTLQKEAGTRFRAYCTIIECIGAQDVERLDNSSEVKGDALYLAAGICGEQFWTSLINRIKSCIALDVEDGDLRPHASELLMPLLEVAADMIPKDRE